jgi:hypothetical protein
MPNWCMNTVTIRGTTEKLQAIIDAAKDDKLLEHLVPIGEWEYGKALEMWGTKWDVTNCDADWTGSPDKDEIYLNFDTAWGPPTIAYDNYTDANDDMHIEASYYEPGMAFVGEYDSGLDINMSHEVDFEFDNWADSIPQNLIDDWALEDEYENWKDMYEEDEEEME